jgi:hypothetical protein
MLGEEQLEARKEIVMITRNSTVQREDAPIIKAEPLLTGIRYARKLTIISGSALFVIIIAGRIILAAAHIHIYPVMIVALNFLLFVIMCSLPGSIIQMLMQERFWKRLERRRQAAVRGDESLLAAEQPIPDATALQLPLTIEQRPDWFKLLTMLGIPLLLALILAVILVAFPPDWITGPYARSITPDIMYIIATVIVGLTLVLCGVLAAILYNRVRQQLTVTETGLIKPGFRKVQSISWNEARLFAIDGIYGGKKYPYPTVYELSSANEIIRWMWIRSTWRIIFFARPAVSQEEHNRQMQVLLSLIAARTGLPLYDLR